MFLNKEMQTADQIVRKIVVKNRTSGRMMNTSIGVAFKTNPTETTPGFFGFLDKDSLRELGKSEKERDDFVESATKNVVSLFYKKV